MPFRIVALIIVGLLISATRAVAQADTPSVPRVAFDETLDAPPVLTSDHVAATPSTVSVRARIPVMARVAVTRAALEPAPGVYTFDRLDDRLAHYAARDIPVWLAVHDVEHPLEETDRWRAFVRALAARRLAEVRIVELVLDGDDPALEAFLFKRAATELSGSHEQLLVALGTTPAAEASRIEALYDQELAPYVDAVAIPFSIGAEEARAIETVLDRRDPSARLLVTGVPLGDADEAARRTFITTEVEALGGATLARSYEGAPARVPAALRAAGEAIADLLARKLVALDPEASSLRLTRDGRDLRPAVRHRLLYDVESLATYLVYRGDASAEGALEVSLTLPVEGTVVVRDPLGEIGGPAEAYARDASTHRVSARVPLRPRPLIVHFNEDAAAVVSARADVAGRRSLRVEEIIARHRRHQAAQEAVVDHYTASVRMEQYFRPTVTDPGYLVVTENRYFAEGRDVEWEELSFSVNGTRWGPDRPPFPLLQAENVLSVPLDLQLTDDYRYTLQGTAEVAGHACYVVRFEPVDRTRSLYRGTAWIDQERFALVKVQTVQTGLSAPVVSNEEVHTFETVSTVAGRPIVLLTHLTSRQLVRLAGRNLLVEKRVAFSDVRVNEPSFAQARANARAGDRVMYKETDRGLRYFVKEGDGRVVSDQPTRSAKALAMGVTIDPSFDFPLPIVGLNYLNFELGSPDRQLALLFGGVLAAGNIQWARVGPTPFDASVDFFAIAVPSSDRLYDEQGEREGERLLTWPMNLGLNLGYQFTDFQRVALQYQLRFDAYLNERTTDEAFVRPPSTLTNGVGATYEYRRGGYSVVTWGTWFGRAPWRAWGLENRPQPVERTYLKYGAVVARDVQVGLFQRIHVDAAYFGGSRLDRLSQYQFGLFDETRIHGVPASGLRVDELAALRGSYSFNIFEQYRLDLFVDRAWGRDRGLEGARSSDWQPITGLGASVNLRAPWRTILRAEVSKSFLPRQYRSLGSTVVQVLFLKPL